MFDPSSADGRSGESALETELRAALAERSAAITTKTLIRPELPAVQEIPRRQPVSRWRVAGAMAAVAAVIVAVVLSRGLIAPQTADTAAPAQQSVEPERSTASLSPPSLSSARLTDRLWVAQSIDTGNNSFSVASWATSGTVTMIAEFSTDGTVVFHDGNNEVRGRYSVGGSTMTVSGAGGWVSAAVTHTDTYLQESAALGRLLSGMPAPVILRAAMIDNQLSLSHGDTTIRYRMGGVSPSAAVAAGATDYPLAAAVGKTWRAATVRVSGQDRVVVALPAVTVALDADGMFTIDDAGALWRGRWWATGDGLVVSSVSGSGSPIPFYPNASVQTPPDERIVSALQSVGTAMSTGNVTVRLAAQGAQLILTPLDGWSDGAPVPVTFVQQ